MNYVVLLSGGLDSATALGYISNLQPDPKRIVAVSFIYGQKHYKEITATYDLATYYKVKRHIIDLELTGIYEDSKCTLLRGRAEVAKGSYAEQLKEKPSGIVNTYVPFRNGLMVSAAAAYGMSYFNNEPFQVVLSAHADDAAGNAYPDCSEYFCKYMSSAIYFGTGAIGSLLTPFVNMKKHDIVVEGHVLKVPYGLTWSCYEGGENPCGKCGTCIDRLKAFEINGLKDPLIYPEGV